MYKYLRTLALAWLLILPALPVQAGAGLDRLNAFYRDVHSLRAHFDQMLLDSDGGMVQESSGTVAIERPDRFRWDYTKPYPQLIVGDGRRLWIYDSELEQVTVKRMDKAMGNAPALVLSGNRPLAEEFHIKELGRRDGLLWVQLTPKRPENDFKDVRIGFGTHLERMDLEDNFGQVTRIHFTDLQRNPKLPPKLFHFVVPKGVDVVGQP